MVGKTLMMSGLLAGAALLGSGCWCPSLQGSGVMKTETRSCSADIQELTLCNHVLVTVVEGAEPGIVIEGDDNIVPYIRTRQEGKTLVVENAPELEGGYSSRKGIRLRLTLPRACLREVRVTSHGSLKVPQMAGADVLILMSSHGNVSVDEVRGEHVRIDLSSHGDLKIGTLEGGILDLDMSSHGDVAIEKGTVKKQHVVLSSHGQYRAEGLVSGTADVTLSSHGDVVVHATDHLKAHVSSHGTIRYRGKPRVEVPARQSKRVRPL